MKLQNIVVSIILIFMVMSGVLAFVLDLGTNYNKSTDLPTLSNMNNNITQQFNTQNDLSKRLIGNMSFTMSRDNFFFIPYEMINSAWNMIKLVLNTVWNIPTTLITTIISMSLSGLGIPIPGWVDDAVGLLFTTIVIWILLAALFKWKFES